MISKNYYYYYYYFLGSTAQLRPWPSPQNPAEFLGGFSTIIIIIIIIIIIKTNFITFASHTKNLIILQPMWESGNETSDLVRVVPLEEKAHKSTWCIFEADAPISLLGVQVR
jgi:hypothetical protein